MAQSEQIRSTTPAVQEAAGVVNLQQETAVRVNESLTRLALRRLRRDYLSMLAIGLLGSMILLALFSPLVVELYGASFTATNNPPLLEIGAPGHPLGTDDLGRDYLARLLYGGRVSLGIGVAAAIASLSIGMILGVAAGFYQGGPFKVIDDILMWFITTLNSIPSIYLLIIVASVMAPTVWSFILVLSLLSWTGTMRLVRGETLSHREREYVIAARSIGARAPRIMFLHILPNIFSILIVTLAIDIGGFILLESALSYLGLGVRPPTPSWGNMLSNAQSFYSRGEHLVIIPGLMIVITVLATYVLGDGLRDAFDRSRQ
ncbi:MAG: ABC transporter permease, partial [Anaerolineae bacterium]|nr:ABC transporter permease [Anaerolineae bacterium]